jgi:two-component system CheB/CheR fusion protein
LSSDGSLIAALPQELRDMPTRKGTPRRGRPAAGPAKGHSKTPQEQDGAAAAAPVTLAVAPHEGQRFPIVGIGASAGGLEALRSFFGHMPSNPGVAFIVVTHLAPDQISLPPELLQRCTSLPVRKAADGMNIEPNSVYVNTPAHDLAILHGILRLFDSSVPHHVPLPIDFFLRSLAEDQHERAVGVILSGTGSDGAVGLRAIKGESGMTIAQAPASAQFAGMPESAIATGVVDYVLPAEEMPARISAYAKGSYLAGRADSDETTPSLDSALQQMFVLIRNRTGHDFSLYKLSTIRRRIERRMSVHRIEAPGGYVRFLRENPSEIEILFRDLLIGVTNFFRDPAAFEVLRRTALPALLRFIPENQAVRVWVPGCSTGEEAYSVAIALRECMHDMKVRFNVQVFGTDLDGRAIECARNGLYPRGIAANVGPERLRRHFVEADGHYRINDEIRETLVFAPHDVLKDPPFTKLNFIACRNLLIYLKSDVQKRLLSLFRYALRPHGLLFLGSSETIDGFTDDFETIDHKWKLYARNETAPPCGGVAELCATRRGDAAVLPPGVEPTQALRRTPTADVVEKMLLHRYAPPTVVINDRGDIIHTHGHTGSYLEMPSGQPRLNILAMAREGLRIPLATAVRKALSSDTDVVQDGIVVTAQDGQHVVKLSVRKIAEPEALKGLLTVVFERPQQRGRRSGHGKKATSAQREGASREDLELQLQLTREGLQSTIEELQSANEEVESTNEELQSGNEELEASKEEMQSLNEELQTVNAELSAKIDGLSQANDDLSNLLNNTEIATVFLDVNLNIRWFTADAKRVIKLIDSDVGRPVGDIMHKLLYHALEADVRTVLQTLVPKEQEVETIDGNWYLMRILPYRTADNAIDGLVITFVDVNAIKEAAHNKAMEEAHALTAGVVETIREPLLVLDAAMRVISANPSFYRTFQTRPEETEQRAIFELGDGQWDIPELRTVLEQVLPQQRVFENFRVEHDFPSVGRRMLLLNARRLEWSSARPALILLAMEDITDHPRAVTTPEYCGAPAQ